VIQLQNFCLAEEKFNSVCGSLRVLNSHVSSIALAPHACLQDQEQSKIAALAIEGVRFAERGYILFD